MKRKTMVVSTAAPIENRTMRFRPKDPSPGRARALVAKPKVESAPETEAPPPVPLPALTDKIYCAHVFEIDGFEPIEIKPGAAGYCTIAQALAQAFAQAHNSNGASEGIAGDPKTAFTLTGFNKAAKWFTAKLNENAPRMAISMARASNIESNSHFTAAKHFDLTGRRASQHIFVPPPPPPSLYPNRRTAADWNY